MNKKYYTSMMLAAGAALCAAGNAHAQTTDNERSLAPLVMIVLDTSGSMCDGAVGGTEGDTASLGTERCKRYKKGHTKLSKAVADLAGAPILKPGKNYTTTSRVLPRSTWVCDNSRCEYRKFMPNQIFGGTSSKYEGVSTIDEELLTESDKTSGNYDNAYNDDGIIQKYQSDVKFGFAGMANGTNDAVADDPSAKAIERMGGDTDAALRFTIIWNDDKSSYRDRDDNDLHVQEWNFNGTPEQFRAGLGSYTKGTHVYYGNHYSSKGTEPGYSNNYALDVDKCIGSCDTNFDPERHNPKTHGCPEPAGENIRYKTTRNMNVGDKFYYYVHHFHNCDYSDGDRRNGFVATVNTSSCRNYTVEYNDPSPGNRFPQICDSTFTYNGTTYTYGDGSYSTSSKGCIELGVVTYLGDGKFDYEELYTKHADPRLTTVDSSGATSGNLSALHMYGFNAPAVKNVLGSTKDTVKYGLNLSGKPYKTPHDCGQDLGMWDSYLSTPAPLFYPTVENDPEKIAQSNKALIDNIRSYTATAATPIGEVLADLYYMFGADNSDFANYQPTKEHHDNGDEALFAQTLSPGADPTYDNYYACRDKAVIFITDGKPTGSGLVTSGNDAADELKHGFSDSVWWDANHLRKNGIKVYTIAYGKDFVTNDYATLNKMAFYGGTCRHPDDKLLLDPDNASDVSKFNAMLAYNVGKSVENMKNCYYDASDAESDQLSKVLESVISDMLMSTVSKTKIATTSALGMKNNIDATSKAYNNGYYTVYSGYDSTLGEVRNTKLQRETTACNHESGFFEVDEEQFLDFTHRLNCRLATYMRKTKEKSASGEYTGRYILKKDEIAGLTKCAQNDSNVEGFENQNNCINKRYIFAGNYTKADKSFIEVEDDMDPRNRIYPENANLTDKTESHYVVGTFNTGYKDASGTPQAYHFLENHTSSGTSCSIESNTNINTMYGKTNYILSPYECVNDYDCAMDEDANMLKCDLGRCVPQNALKALPRCNQYDNFYTTASGEAIERSDKICIAKHLRTKGSECHTHADCQIAHADPNSVCHAGTCVTGTVINCDLRQFIATQPLGAIEYATPVPVNPPTRNYKSNSYITYSKVYWTRDTMLLVGANDGMLHSFILGDNLTAKDYNSGLYKIDPKLVPDSNLSFEEGDELWSFIPKAVMPNLYKLTEFGAQKHVNATPVVADVQAPSHINYDVVTDPSDDSKTVTVQWRTVVVGGFRDGARGYYALDITNPGQPKILWEIDNTFEINESGTVTAYNYPDMANNSNSVTKTEEDANKDIFPFLRMGYSYPEPIITNLLIDDTIEPVAILAGGMNNNSVSNDLIGKALYIVRLFPKTPKDLLVKKFVFDNKITGAPAVFPSNFNATAKLIYVGDDSGSLYRLDVSNGVVESWGKKEDGVEVSEEPIFNPADSLTLAAGQKFERITFKPAVSLYKNGTNPIIQIAFGTGSNDNLNVADSDHNYVANFYDVFIDGHYELNPESAISASVIPQPMLYAFNYSENTSKDGTTKEWTSSGSSPESSSIKHKYKLYTVDPKSGTKIDPRQKMTGAPITYNYITYFPSFIASNSAESSCTKGHAAIWSIGNSAVSTRNYQVITDAARVQNLKTDSTDRFKDHNIFELSPGTKIYGLDITNQMICKKNDGTTKIAAPQLVALTTANFSDEASLSDGTQKLHAKNTDIESFAMDLEAFSPEVNRLSWASVYE